MRKIKILNNKDLVMTEFSKEDVKETTYRPYDIGSLPKEFGCREFQHNGKVKIGMSNWFKFKGLTYVKITN
tara:strand:- start:287 stop:499 length:213 start_codon:yes stop_codon:yes gene_type:complete